MSDTKPIFDEDALRQEIVKTWGEYGAHVEVYDHVLRLARRAPTPVEAGKLRDYTPEEEAVYQKAVAKHYPPTPASEVEAAREAHDNAVRADVFEAVALALEERIFNSDPRAWRERAAALRPEAATKEGDK
jgi:hypothetical protein